MCAICFELERLKLYTFKSVVSAETFRTSSLVFSLYKYTPRTKLAIKEQIWWGIACKNRRLNAAGETKATKWVCSLRLDQHQSRKKSYGWYSVGQLITQWHPLEKIVKHLMKAIGVYFAVVWLFSFLSLSSFSRDFFIDFIRLVETVFQICVIIEKHGP